MKKIIALILAAMLLSCAALAEGFSLDEPEEADLKLLHEAGELLRSRLPDPRQRTAVDAETAEALLSFLMRQEGEE